MATTESLSSARVHPLPAQSMQMSVSTNSSSSWAVSAMWWWLFRFRSTCALSFFRRNFRHASYTMGHWKLSTALLGPCPGNKHQANASMYCCSRSRRRLPRTSTSSFEKVITAPAAAGASLGPWDCAWACWRAQVTANAPARFAHSKSVWRSTRFVLTHAGYLKTPGIWIPLYSIPWVNRMTHWN